MMKTLMIAGLVLGTACASTKAVGPKVTPATKSAAPPLPTTVAADGSRTPVVDPAVAYMLGLMPVKNTGVDVFQAMHPTYDGRDRKSTRLNSSHVRISYAVFC